MILTNEEIKRIGEGNTGSWQDDLMFARAIESAVLAKLKAQEPVGWMAKNGEVCRNGWRKFHAREDDIDRFDTPLYEHPLPPDDVVRDAERYRWLREVAPNMFWDSHDKEIGFVKFDTKACLWKPEIFDAAIDKAIGE